MTNQWLQGMIEHQRRQVADERCDCTPSFQEEILECLEELLMLRNWVAND